MIKADIIDLVHEKIGFSRHESRRWSKPPWMCSRRRYRKGSGFKSSALELSRTAQEGAGRSEPQNR